MKLKATAAVAAFCAPIIAASSASAQEITWYYGVDFVSDYISSGVTNSDGKAAIQPWVEAEIGNFYFGTWMSNVDFGAGDDNSWETDLYFGYRNSINDQWSYDIGYARYLYDGNLGNCCGEIVGQVFFSPTSALDLTGYVAYDPEFEFFNYRAEVGYAINDNISLEGQYGHSESLDHDYWLVGGSYAFNDFAAANVTYHGTANSVFDDAGWVATVSFAF
ncbi:uncharacterized protein (TIGR02001 family) [Shimia isoporae]|uniref:Uncharacterized protein (TIGR02001 family) n=1 Tax=Shimia isoporae TaxID=647720 RepID=A0A4R1N7B2_9RHOB|nr:TorF family putative porin [Shimia isoporae]TCK98949.1 uncharacterized protein (TIGR02001 family) [Shimia isoporae]